MKGMKKMLYCIVTMYSGDTFSNPLKLEEAHLVSQLAKENRRVLVTYREVTKEQYKSYFG